MPNAYNLILGIHLILLSWWEYFKLDGNNYNKSSKGRTKERRKRETLSEKDRARLPFLSQEGIKHR